jgi:hypothetical protein
VRQTGLPDAEQRLICIGDAVPVPDWELYQNDPFAMPDVCADGGHGVQLSTRAPNVTLISPEQSLPSSLRADIAYRTPLPLQVSGNRLSGNFRYTYSHGIGLWGYRDLNLDASRRFTLSGEGRPFFGDPAGIVERTGATSLASSRRHEEFGNVYEIVADRQSSSHQLTASTMGFLPGSVMFSVNYTLGFARDQGSASGGFGGFGGMGGAVPTAGSPNDVEWATSSNDRRHTMNLLLTYPLRPWMEIGGMARMSSGAPFTPIVNRDINGDGLRNDRAFVFDPRAAGTDRVRSCLESQLGSIADRNSCRNGWTQSLDMRLGLRPNLPTVQRRFTLNADFRNVLTGLDQLVNGRNDMRGWGEGQRADPNLLEVRAFDPLNSRFIYDVNEGFGQARRGPNAFRNAFSVTLSGRMTVGGQPMMSNVAFGQSRAAMGGFAALLGGGRGMGGMGGGMGGGAMIFAGHGGAAAGIGEIVALFRDGSGSINVDSILRTMMSNPVATVLELRDSLALNPDQAAAVQAIADTLQAQLDQRRANLAPVLESMAAAAGGGLQPQAMPQLLQQLQLQVQPNLDGARREAGEAMRMTQRELTEAQWAMLPETVRGSAAGRQQRGPGAGFNALGMIDRMLANPIPVLLELKDTLALTEDQVTRVQAVSDELQTRLSRRREELGRRFDNVEAQQQGRVFQEIQPEIERTRNEVTAALRQVERILTRQQWEQVPERIRSPFQAPVIMGGRRGGG